MKIKLVLSVVLTLLILLGGGFYLYNNNPQWFGKATEKVKQENELVDRLAYVQDNFDSSRVPDLLPSGLPFESGAVVTQNYNATSKDGSRQSSVRVYESKKSIAASYEAYRDFFTSKKFTIFGDIVDDKSALISGRLGDIVLTVDISENVVSKKRTVQVTAYKDIK